MKCASCGAAVHPAADFCGVCGGDAPRPKASSAPRLSGIEFPDVAAGLAGLRTSAPAVSMPGVSRRMLAIAGAGVAGIVIALLLVNAALGADDGSAARQLAAAKTAIEQRDAKIAALEGTVATNTQMQSALQSSAQGTKKENDVLKGERDSAKQEVTALEAKLKQTETSLKDAQTTVTKQTADLKTLAGCLNGTSVALAFGRSGRWPSADLALGAVAAACKASEPLLQR